MDVAKSSSNGGIATGNAGGIAVNGDWLAVSDLVIAGWTGRNEEAVEAHIRELEEIGVPRPASTPIFYRVAASLLSQADRIQVAGENSSGEAEPVLLNVDGRLMVGVGSDHTDRQVETYNVTVSKQVCAKPISTDFWAFDEVMDHWDSLVLRSFAHVDGERIAYQEGTLAAIRPPDDLLAKYAAAERELTAGSAMYCGTLAVIGELRYASAFTVELEDPVRDRLLSHTYAVDTLPLR